MATGDGGSWLKFQTLHFSFIALLTPRSKICIKRGASFVPSGILNPSMDPKHPSSYLPPVEEKTGYQIGGIIFNQNR